LIDSNQIDDAPLYPIASVDKALRLLLMFHEHREIRLSEAAVELGVASSTAHRLLAMLVYHGFVRQNPETKVYAPGSALYDIGLALVRRLDMGDRVRRVLEEAARETGETVHAGILEGSRVRYIDAVESDKALRVAARTGMTLPAHCSAAGKALLAPLDLAELATLYPDPHLPQATTRSIRSRARLKDVLEQTRRHGYAENREESEEGVVAVGVALPGDPGRPPIGISCAAPSSRMDATRSRRIGALLLEIVSRAAGTLTAELHAVSR